jgi:predicted GIY-YIG superfamily endonuclease
VSPNNLPARIYQHQTGRGAEFTRKYGIRRLVWYETYDMVTDAIQRNDDETLAASVEDQSHRKGKSRLERSL